LSEVIFSICHTTARPDGWQESYRAWIDRAAHPETVEYILCVDERWGFLELPKLDGAGDKAVWNTGRKCLVDGANIAAANAFGQVLIINSDDMFPRQDWDVKLLEAIEAFHSEALDGGDFVVRTSPGAKYQAWLDAFVSQGRDSIISRLITCQILSRARYQRFGYALYPEFASMMADTDFTAAAEHDGVVIEARDIEIEHRHPFVIGASQDDVSKHENQMAAHELGARIYARRQAERTGSALVHAAEPKRVKLAALLPGDVFPWTWVDNWSRLLLHLGNKFEFAWTFQSCSNQYFARDFAWQSLQRHMLKSNWTPDYVLWLDSDNILTEAQFDLLYYAIENGTAIDAIGGWYWIDVEPPQVCARVRETGGAIRSITIDELQYASDNLRLLPINDHMGFGAMLMRWSVMAGAGQWPFTPMLQTDWKRIMMEPLQPDSLPGPIGPYKGDDVSFCHRAIMERGFKFFVHPEVYLPHLKRKDIPAPRLKPRERLQMLNERAEANAAD